MPWLVLVTAGLLEIVWAIAMKQSQGFTRPVPSLITVLALVASMGLLAWSLRTLPVGSAYAVWVGIGAAGTAIVGMLALGEPVTAPRIVCLVVLLGAIVGLRLTTPTP
ncbi:MAG: multidrug efflux SMR transporter [Myxococcota bacterium]|nr:multidrug efflux SMR transporter [Myxococcota bacterium]